MLETEKLNKINDSRNDAFVVVSGRTGHVCVFINSSEFINY